MERTIIPVKPLRDKKVAVIGAGIFGISAALELSDLGCDVTIFDKEPSICSGATLVNQNRMHRGYHYPRSIATAESSKFYETLFRNRYGKCLIDFDHYYCVAKDSLVTPEQYLKFCDDVGLEYSLERPDGIVNVELCVKAKESIFDINTLISLLVEELYIRKIKFLRQEVTSIKSSWLVNNMYFDAVVNATYANTNVILKLADLPVADYQYEQCEIVVVSAPLPLNFGVGVMDGPYSGVLPFGNRGTFMLYDVEHSVLSRTIGELPDLPPPMDDKHRFKRYIDKISQFVPAMSKAIYRYSMYCPKVVLLNHEKDDARPTEIIHSADGFYSVFSGKISAALPAARKIANEIERYLCQSK